MAEDQVGPASPGMSLYDDGKSLPTSSGASRRIRPGTKAEDMAEGPPLVELSDIDSAFQLTEHLKALHHSYTHPPDSDTLHPVTAEIARQLSTPPSGTSRDIWLYELCRFLIQKTNAIIVALFSDSPPCSSHTCPEMRASEWQYLCAVHEPPKSCCAIDYCCHTLDLAATTLTSSKMFPSRLGLGSGNGMVSGDKVLTQQMKEIKNIFRRVYRIYAHAWFQHREVFWRVEGKTGLYVFFKTVCDMYGIIESDNYTIPAEAEGQVPPELDEPETPSTAVEAPSILKRGQEFGGDMKEPAGNSVIAMGDTTKRHRHTMSDRGSSVSTVIQEEEEDEEPAPPSIATLGRQPTALRDFAEDPDVQVEEQEVEPSPETEEPEIFSPPIRSETVKPEDLREGGAEEMKEDTEAEDAGEQTMVEIEGEESGAVEEIKEEPADETNMEEKTESKSEETPVQATEETQDQTAAKGEHAGKSVED